MYKQIIDTVYNTVDWQALPQLAEWVIEEAMHLQQIPAPTFDEKNRATHVQQRFASFGLEERSIDERYNVYGLLRGKTEGPAVMVCAHTDTVFPGETDLTLQKQNGIISGPGLGDNSVGVTGMLGLLKTLKDQAITPVCDIWFVATSREEGLGDLGGIRMAYETLADKIKAVVNIEGLSFGYIYNAGIAVKRLCISATTEGGHSWVHFGNASAIHAIANLAAKITEVNIPTKPRTTYNIGMIKGGQSINSIAAQAELWLDMRSERQDALDALEQQVQALIQAASSDKVKFEVKVVGNRPSGSIPDDHPLVQLALASLEKLDMQGTLEMGSTDGNVPLAANCPTVTIGITRGGNAHRLDEFLETAHVPKGMCHLITVALAACQTEPEHLSSHKE